jgi:hypothetical protein
MGLMAKETLPAHVEECIDKLVRHARAVFILLWKMCKK